MVTGSSACPVLLEVAFEDHVLVGLSVGRLVVQLEIVVFSVSRSSKEVT